MKGSKIDEGGLSEGINQAMGAVFEEAVREAVCQGR